MSSLSFLDDSAPIAAKRLLGCYLERTLQNGQILIGRIVETEAYDMSDAASHSFNGVTERTRIMFGPAGYLYVYFTYGMHYCCNVVVGPRGYGAAVLIRAIEPIQGADYMETRRGRTGVLATNGPAKACQAMNIDVSHNGTDLSAGSIRVVERTVLKDSDITTTTRIGISRAQEMPWRFYISNSPYVSHR